MGAEVLFRILRKSPPRIVDAAIVDPAVRDTFRDIDARNFDATLRAFVNKVNQKIGRYVRTLLSVFRTSQSFHQH